MLEANSLGVIASIKTEAKDVRLVPACWASERDLHCSTVDKPFLGRFAIDFVVVRSDKEAWQPYAIQVNLRKGGTTHPFLTLQFLTDGSYDPDGAVFLTPGGHEKHFVATDHLESPAYRAFSPDDLFDIAVRHGLHFDQTRETGVVFHMLASLAENGQIGLVAIGGSAAEADALYRRTQSVLDDESRLALAPRVLPAFD